MRYYYGTRTSIHIYTYRISSNLYTPDSVLLASLARQLQHTACHEAVFTSDYILCIFSVCKDIVVYIFGNIIIGSLELTYQMRHRSSQVEVTKCLAAEQAHVACWVEVEHIVV